MYKCGKNARARAPYEYISFYNRERWYKGISATSAFFIEII
jgi:hypothetical protein